MRRRVVVCLGLLSVLTAAAAGAPSPRMDPATAPALRSFVVHGTGTVPAANADAVDQAVQLAADTGATVERALTYSQVTTQWDGTVDGVQRMDPSNFTSAYRTGVEDTGGELVFVHRPSAAVVAVIRQLPFDTTVFTGAPASADVLEQAQDATDAAVRAVGLTPRSASTDPRTSAITVTVAPGATPDQLATGRAVVAATVAGFVGLRRVSTDIVIGGAAGLW